MGSLLKRSRKALSDTSRKGSASDSQPRQPASTWSESVARMQSEVDDKLRDFEFYVKEITETSLKLEELTKMVKSDEISENAYELIADELGDQLSTSVEQTFKLRETLELARAKAKLEWAKEKVGLREFEDEEVHSILQYDGYVKGHMDLIVPVSKWEDVVSKIDAALSSLQMEQEASIIERYLSFVAEKFSAGAASEEAKRVKEVCQNRLDSISERWGSTRRGKIEQVMDLELKASRIKDDKKEVEVRFAVGELDQRTFEYKMNVLQASLKRITKEISEIRDHMDDMDMKIFRCSELVGANP